MYKISRYFFENLNNLYYGIRSFWNATVHPNLKKKYVDLPVRPQIINYTWSLQWISLEPQLSAENEVLSVLSELLEAFNSMKQVAMAIVLILSFS